MVRLRLLGGPAEEYTCVVISGDDATDHAAHDQAAERLRSIAQQRHRDWLEAPDNPARKLAYALALIEWGAWTNNREAQDHGGKLYREYTQTAR